MAARALVLRSVVVAMTVSAALAGSSSGVLAGPAADAGTATGGAAPVGTGAIRLAGGATAVPNSYIVVLAESAVGGRAGSARAATAVPGRARALARSYGGTVRRTYAAALTGFEATMTERDARRLAADPAVAYVEQNHTVSITDTQTNATWGLDRIDQRARPLNTTYTYPTTAAAVRAYVIDTGVLTTHTQFGGRAGHGYDAVDGDTDATDCHGHGTHVAGTIGGSTYGVAKAVAVVAVRVLNCGGSGTLAGVLGGVDWVTDNAVLPAVANMSLGGGASSAIDDAVAASIAKGVTYAVAAGNSGASACDFSPARTPTAITVGATTNTDARAAYSNYGTCLDIFAPGTSITSAWSTGASATNTISGTSMATPHVAGAAALVLAANPDYTPAEVRDYLLANATAGVVTGPGAGSPNQLLFVVN